MTWKKGETGNPLGRIPDRHFAEALRLAVNMPDQAKGYRKLRAIAEKLVEKALQGESWAIAQVADRLDGKPAQESNVNVNTKRNAADWSRHELVAFLNEQGARRNGTAAAGASEEDSDKRR